MVRPCRSPLLLVLLALAALAASPVAHALVRPRDGRPAYRVLFVGNSYTRANDLPHVMQRIAAGVPGGVSIRVAAITQPGWDLARHWSVPHTRAAIAGGGFTHVVLQDHSLSALQHCGEFERFVRLFDGEIDRIGARTVLYETWARREGSRVYRRERLADGPVDMQARISECYAQLARRIGADVAPAGRAFLLAQQRLGDAADLYRSDGAHPSRNGTYLAAAVLYAVITGDDPRRTRYRPHRMGRRLAAQLREVARTALLAAR